MAMPHSRGSPRVHEIRPTPAQPDHEPLWVESADLSPLVVLIVRDEHGHQKELTGYLSTFLGFAQKLVEMAEQMGPPELPYDAGEATG